MATIIGDSGSGDKLLLWGLGLLMVSFIISLPFMARDKAKLEAQQWHDNGCKMYDESKPADIPAKCSSYFIDHYKAQQQRLQPPVERGSSK